MNLKDFIKQAIDESPGLELLYAYQTTLKDNQYEIFALLRFADRGELVVITSDKQYNERKKIILPVTDSFRSELENINFWQIKLNHINSTWLYKVAIGGYKREGNEFFFSETGFTDEFPMIVKGVRDIFSTLTGAYVLGQRPSSLTRTLSTGYTFHCVSNKGKNQVYVQIDFSEQLPGIFVKHKLSGGIDNIPILFKDPGAYVKLSAEERDTLDKSIIALGVWDLPDTAPSCDTDEDCKLVMRGRGKFRIVSLCELPEHTKIKKFFERIADNPANWQSYMQ